MITNRKIYKPLTKNKPMLEKLIKPISKKLTALALASTILLSSGCSTYKTISPQSIKEVAHKSGSTEINHFVNYDAMTWQEAINYVETPEEAQDYLDRHFTYDDNEKVDFPGLDVLFFHKASQGESFKYNHTRKKGVCIDYATAAAALLSDNDYPPLVLCIKTTSPTGKTYKHAVFLYHQESGFGTVGNTAVKQQYPTIRELVTTLIQKNNPNSKPLSYAVVNLDTQWERDQWIKGDINMQKTDVDKWIAIQPPEKK